MSNFEILKQEIIECRIRAKSNETIQVLSYLQEFAENNLNNGWISIDNPPPHSDRYLCQVKSRNGEISIKINYLYSDDNAYNKRILGVTHWQYLPNETENKNADE